MAILVFLSVCLTIVIVSILKRGGFFVECGAMDGERSSNTLWIEQNLKWNGLLIEADPYFYTQLLGKNRRAWSINACLSPSKYTRWVGIIEACLVYSNNIYI